MGNQVMVGGWTGMIFLDRRGQTNHVANYRGAEAMGRADGGQWEFSEVSNDRAGEN